MFDKTKYGFGWEPDINQILLIMTMVLNKK